jgi:8-oxo-dGTP pyrophosphatase MutT (NUDIX family)
VTDAGPLRRLLRTHRSADEHEAAHARRIEDILTTADPFDRNRHEPGHVTASAFVLHPSRAAIALIHHAALDRWLQPGGHVEASDPDVESAARREVAEETGIVRLQDGSLLDLDVHTVPARGPMPAHLHFDVRWWFRAGTDRLEAGEGTLDARWVSLADAMTMERSVARPARKLAGTLARP